jgi:hypothetical protein
MRPLDDVSWATFPAIAALITKGTASRAQVYALQDSVHSFECNICDRLAHKNDIFTLESCSVFDQVPELSSEMRLCEHDICAIFASCLEPMSLRFSPRPRNGSLK